MATILREFEALFDFVTDQSTAGCNLPPWKLVLCPSGGQSPKRVARFLIGAEDCWPVPLMLVKWRSGVKIGYLSMNYACMQV